MTIQTTPLRFYYQTMLGSTGSTMSGSSTSSTSDFSKDYVFNMLETNRWQASSTTSPQWLLYDAGAGNTQNCDYFAVTGHNLAASTIDFQYSDDAVVFTNVTPAFAVADNNAILKEFTSTAAHRYWRLHVSNSTGFSAAPYVTLAIWGNKTELDYVQPAFDPYAQTLSADIHITQGGYVAGIHTRYTERTLNINFNNASTALYSKVKSWWEDNGFKNFFVAWNSTAQPTDIWLMRPDTRFVNPINANHYRDISIALRGRKE